MSVIVTVLLSVIAIVGNALTVVLFIKNSKWLKQTHSCLIVALAIQDILTAFCLLAVPSFALDKDHYAVPSNLAGREIFCRLIWSLYLPFALGVTSVYTCLMLTIERWFAVLKPLYYKRLEQSPVVVTTLVLIPWIAGFGFEISYAINAKPIEQNGTFICGLRKDERSANERIFFALLSFLGMMFIPAVIMTIAYVHIVLHMKRSLVSTARRFKTLKRVTLTAFFASTIVVVCWLPEQIYCTLSLVQLTAQHSLPAEIAVMLLAFSNSCVNPFIYSFSNHKYREGLKEIFGVQEKLSVIGISLKRDNVVHTSYEGQIKPSE